MQSPDDLDDLPQPLGVFPLPAGFLVLPALGVPGEEEARRALLAGDAAAELPAGWSFAGHAYAGRDAEALEALAAAPGALAAYNRFVLSPGEDGWSALTAAAPGDLRLLAQAAAWFHGLAETPPPPPVARRPEARALLALVAAAGLLGDGRTAEAREALADGAAAAREVSPLLAAQLLVELAEIEPDDAAAIQGLREALRLARDARLPGFRASLLLALALRLHQQAGTSRPGLLAAIEAYQEAVHAGLSAESDPLAYGLAQSNLGLAYLTLPMAGPGAPLRMGVAVQAFREALRVYDRDAHPEEWTSAQLNLANALVYLPSSHPEENLAQAVGIYEELLAARPRALDPLGHARILHNQANALAHLGIFAPALHKLEEAHKLFHWHGEPELAAAALEQAHRINQRIAAVD
jgi:tetratricopeptide (TPR) repeat protein